MRADKRRHGIHLDHGESPTVSGYCVCLVVDIGGGAMNLLFAATILPASLDQYAGTSRTVRMGGTTLRQVQTFAKGE
ncbi:hypothetical protein NKI01_16695 [Mesorhizobium sp. M0815]|uniref:hypothetical protein n=1 Tax=unclassified Mesorhizobium TaxID=325217 RepID=UPI003334D317